jgi:hypothetical protein
MSMKTKNQTSLILSILAAFVLIFSSCKKTDSFSNTGKYPTVASRAIKDAEVIISSNGANFQSVMLDVQKIEIKEDLNDANDDNDNFADADDNMDDHLKTVDDYGQWKSIGQSPQLIDMASLKNGAETIIGDATAMYRVRKIRITLGTNNYLIDNAGETHPLRLENDVEKVIYIRVYQDDIDEEMALNQQKIHLYFDATNSIKLDNGNYTLDPIVRPFSMKAFGELTGQVFPEDVSSVVKIDDGQGNTIVAYAEKNGEFKIRGLKEGNNYTVTFEALGYITQEVNGVIMEKGKKTELNAITLIQ